MYHDDDKLLPSQPSYFSPVDANIILTPLRLHNIIDSLSSTSLARLYHFTLSSCYTDAAMVHVFGHHLSVLDRDSSSCCTNFPSGVFAVFEPDTETS